MRIPFELAATLAAVIDEGTLEAAARSLRITPSAVSQRIKTLEQIAGRTVLVRSKPARVTAAGTPLVRLARQAALLEHDTLVELGVEASEGVSVSVPLAVNADSLATWFLPALARLQAEHPVVFDLYRDDQDYTARLLESGTVMGAVTSRAAPVAGCRVAALGAMRYEAVASPAYVSRWFPDGVDAASLAVAPMICFDRQDDLQARWLQGRGADARTPPRHYVPASHDFATATLLGLGWSLLPTFQSRQPRERGELVVLGGAPVDVPLYWQRWNLHSALLDAIADAVVAEGRGVLAEMAH